MFILKQSNLNLLTVIIVVNMLLLTLLSIDRFIAVRYPFFYSASVSNKHVSCERSIIQSRSILLISIHFSTKTSQVGIGFLIVLIAGSSLAAASVTLGLQDLSYCRTQSLQMVYLTIVLAICSVLTLFFNSAVLRIAKKQLNAIYAHEPSFRGGGRRKVSVVCTNCGYKNETFVNTSLLPVPLLSGGGGPLTATSTATTTTMSNILPLTDAVVLGPLHDLEQGEKFTNLY